MPPGSPTEVSTALNTLVTDIQRGIDQVVAGFGQVVQSADRFAMLAPLIAPGLGGLAVWWIANHLKEIREALEKVIKVVRTILTNSTPVLSLIHHSFSWISDVKTPASDIVFAAGRDAKLNLVQWSGPAADIYHRIDGEQKDAVGEVVGKADFISSWLYKIVEGNVSYAQETLKTVTSIVGELVQAAVDAETVIDVPWAIDKLASVVGQLVEALLNQLLTIAQRVISSIGSYRDLVSATGDHSKLGPAGWPDAVKG
jgi:hypothetical protein